MSDRPVRDDTDFYDALTRVRERRKPISAVASGSDAGRPIAAA
jgi:hypothetical protein